MYKDMKKKNTKLSIQISEEISRDLHKFCKEHGYKLSGFTEIAIRQAISGSNNNTPTKV